MSNRIVVLSSEEAQEARLRYMQGVYAVLDGTQTEADIQAVCGRSGTVKHDQVVAFVRDAGGTTYHLRRIVAGCPVTSVEGKRTSYDADAFIAAARSVFSEGALARPEHRRNHNPGARVFATIHVANSSHANN